MKDVRKQELLNQVLADLADMNVGSNQNVPMKTVWHRAMKIGITDSEEFKAVLSWAVDEKLLTFTPGGIAGLGSIALTDAGYEQSRSS